LFAINVKCNKIVLQEKSVIININVHIDVAISMKYNHKRKCKYK
jgi:hypothetical protein